MRNLTSTPLMLLCRKPAFLFAKLLNTQQVHKLTHTLPYTSYTLSIYYSSLLQACNNVIFFKKDEKAVDAAGYKPGTKKLIKL